MSTPTVRRPVNPLEAEALSCLRTVRYPVASWDKRFARSLEGSTTITDKEAPQVWRLLKRYRRQWSRPVKRLLLDTAEALAAPDFRKQQKQQQQLARYQEAMKR